MVARVLTIQGGRDVVGHDLHDVERAIAPDGDAAIALAGREPFDACGARPLAARARRVDGARRDWHVARASPSDRFDRQPGRHHARVRAGRRPLRSCRHRGARTSGVQDGRDSEGEPRSAPPFATRSPCMMARRPLLVAALVATAALVPISQRASGQRRHRRARRQLSRYMVVADSAQSQARAAADVDHSSAVMSSARSPMRSTASRPISPRARRRFSRSGPVCARCSRTTSFHTTATTESNATWGLDRIDQSALAARSRLQLHRRRHGRNRVRRRHRDRVGAHRVHGSLNPGFDATGQGSIEDDCIGHGTHVSGHDRIDHVGRGEGRHDHAGARLQLHELTRPSETIVAGLDWVVADHQPGDPAVLNMSLGGPIDSSVNAATTRAVDDGIFVSVAAGNDDFDAC